MAGVCGILAWMEEGHERRPFASSLLCHPILASHLPDTALPSHSIYLPFTLPILVRPCCLHAQRSFLN